MGAPRPAERRSGAQRRGAGSRCRRRRRRRGRGCCCGRGARAARRGPTLLAGVDATFSSTTRSVGLSSDTMSTWPRRECNPAALRARTRPRGWPTPRTFWLALCTSRQAMSARADGHRAGAGGQCRGADVSKHPHGRPHVLLPRADYARRSGHSPDSAHGRKGSHASLGAGAAMVVRTAPDAAATTAAATMMSRVGKRMAAMVT